MGLIITQDISSFCTNLTHAEVSSFHICHLYYDLTWSLDYVSSTNTNNYSTLLLYIHPNSTPLFITMSPAIYQLAISFPLKLLYTNDQLQKKFCLPRWTCQTAEKLSQSTWWLTTSDRFPCSRVEVDGRCGGRLFRGCMRSGDNVTSVGDMKIVPECTFTNDQSIGSLLVDKKQRPIDSMWCQIDGLREEKKSSSVHRQLLTCSKSVGKWPYTSLKR